MGRCCVAPSPTSHLNFRRDNITSMVKDHVERVRSALLGLCEPLHDAFTWAERPNSSAGSGCQSCPRGQPTGGTLRTLFEHWCTTGFVS